MSAGVFVIFEEMAGDKEDSNYWDNHDYKGGFTPRNKKPEGNCYLWIMAISAIVVLVLICL